MNKMLIGNKGFTLIELLIAMAIVGVMGAIAINSFPSTREKGLDTNIMSDLSQYQTLLEQYANSNGGLYPAYVNNSADDLGDSAICGELGANTCGKPNAENYNYRANSSSYYIFATLNQLNDSGNTNYYVVCSNGVRGETTTEPTGDTCPIEI